MQQLTEFLGVVAWPLVVVFVVFLFRNSLREMLSREDVSFSGPGGISISARRATEAIVDAVESKDGGVGAGAAGRVSPEDAADQVHEVSAFVRRLRRSPRLLWVDDRPSNNRHERWALENMGVTVDLSTSTEDAEQKLRRGGYDVVITDMARPQDPRAGYALLESMTRRGDAPPLIIYSSSNAPEHYDEAVGRGAVGSTARPRN